MDQQEPFRTRIPAVSAGTARPLWSVMIPTYHCAEYLRETLASVLAQDPGPDRMQIEVVDDGSYRDDPAAVVEELGRGRVGFYRQPENVGHTRNFDTCLLRARGRLVHVLHGDDRVEPGFYAAMERAFADPEVGAAFCGVVYVDGHGRRFTVSRPERSGSGLLDGWLEKIAVGQRLQTVAMVVRREVYEQLGGFDHRIRHYGEDWEMWVRIAAHHRIWYHDEPLAVYRMHSTSLTGQSMRTGENVQDLRRVIEICGGYLPPDRAPALALEARRNCARFALRTAYRMFASGDREGGSAQVREALRSSRSPEIFGRTALLFVRWMGRTVYRRFFPLQPEAG